MAADPRDILTIDEAKESINYQLTSLEHDYELDAFITGVSLALDAYVGPVVIRTITDEVHDGGAAQIWPRYYPVASVISVTEYAGFVGSVLTSESGTAAGGYVLSGGRVMRRSGGYATGFASGIGNVLVTYTAGRFATTKEVDGRFKLAAKMMLQNLWQPAAAAWAQTPDFGENTTPDRLAARFAVPNAVSELLRDQMIPTGVA